MTDEDKGADEKSEKSHLITLKKNGFAERATPKKADPDELFMFRCSGCNNIHFRHAGYVGIFMPYVKPGGDERVTKDSYTVNVCTKCKKCFVWVDQQMYDVTDEIDLEAWEKSEKELQKATGPGGEC